VNGRLEDTYIFICILEPCRLFKRTGHIVSMITKGVRNYFKLDLLIARSYILLRELFKRRYSLFNGGRIWNDTALCGNNYFSNVINRNKNIHLTAVQKTSIAAGDTNEWDLTTVAEW
jgi:hypothetical protein